MAAITAVVVAVVPGFRQEVAGWLGLRGVSLVDTPGLLEAADVLDLGNPLSLDDAIAETGFRPLIPSELGTPDAVFTIAGQIWMLYEPGPSLTPLSLDGVGAVVVEFETGEGPGLIKTVASSEQGVFFELDGDVALWIEGPHEVGVLDPGGQLAGGRAADNTLLWMRSDLTLRLETTLSRDQAVVIARSFR